MLGTEANGVSDNPLIFPADGEALSGGNFHAEPVAFAADMIAHRALRDRLAVGAPHRDAGRSGALRPAGIPDAEAGTEFRLHDPAGDRRRARLGEQAARLSGERRFHPDLGQPGGSRLDGRAWRAAPAADGGQSLCGLAIELLAAAQGCEFHAPLVSSPPLERVRRVLREKVPKLEEDRHLHPDMAASIALIRSGAVVSAAGAELLPGLSDALATAEG